MNSKKSKLLIVIPQSDNTYLAGKLSLQFGDTIGFTLTGPLLFTLGNFPKEFTNKKESKRVRSIFFLLAQKAIE